MGWNGVYASEVARLSPSNAVGKVTGACMFVVFAGRLARASQLHFQLPTTLGGDCGSDLDVGQSG